MPPWTNSPPPSRPRMPLRDTSVPGPPAGHLHRGDTSRLLSRRCDNFDVVSCIALTDPQRGLLADLTAGPRRV
jgi:hypothetical protein